MKASLLQTECQPWFLLLPQCLWVPHGFLRGMLTNCSVALNADPLIQKARVPYKANKGHSWFWWAYPYRVRKLLRSILTKLLAGKWTFDDWLPPPWYSPGNLMLLFRSGYNWLERSWHNINVSGVPTVLQWCLSLHETFDFIPVRVMNMMVLRWAIWTLSSCLVTAAILLFLQEANY